MSEQIVNFKITNLAAEVNESISLEWQGKSFDSGLLAVELDDSAPGGANQGVLNYFQRRATAEFHLCLGFSEFASTLETLGLDPELLRPVSAVLYSEGDILDDHSFALSGRCDLAAHPLFRAEETKASILPGR